MLLVLLVLLQVQHCSAPARMRLYRCQWRSLICWWSVTIGIVAHLILTRFLTTTLIHKQIIHFSRWIQVRKDHFELFCFRLFCFQIKRAKTFCAAGFPLAFPYLTDKMPASVCELLAFQHPTRTCSRLDSCSLLWQVPNKCCLCNGAFCSCCSGYSEALLCLSLCLTLPSCCGGNWLGTRSVGMASRLISRRD